MPTVPPDSDRTRNRPPVSGSDVTSLHVRRAIEGERVSLEWIVEHFTPLLMTQARYRLSRHLQGLYDPEDLVQKVWAAALPKLGNIVAREGRFTPVLLRFLGTILLRSYQHLIEKHVAGKPGVVELGGSNAEERGDSREITADVAGVVTQCMRRESVGRIDAMLLALTPAHREILILRAIEEMPYAVAASKLGVDEGTLRMRYARALAELRDCLPPSFIDELSDA